MVRSTASSAVSSAVSVISSSSRFHGKPVFATMRSISQARPGAPNCTAETFTDKATFQPRASRQAWRSTQAPIAWMLPFFSASGMNSAGEMNLPLRCQRSSASTATVGTPAAIDDRLVLDGQLVAFDRARKRLLERFLGGRRRGRGRRRRRRPGSRRTARAGGRSRRSCARERNRGSPSIPSSGTRACSLPRPSISAASAAIGRAPTL